MRLYVQKPANGRTALRLDDKRGLTGLRLVEEDVDVKDVKARAGAMCEQWEQRRKEIKDAKKR